MPKKISSVHKGKRGERDWATWLNENLSANARRGASQGFGGAARPDVECDLKIHSEVKFVNRLNIYDAMDQAIRDVRFDNIPIVAHKKNRTPWHVTLLASDLLRLVDEINQFRARQEQHDSGVKGS